ncbi:hypothetical protein [Oceaniovalibus sp. ACAM 378]|uniref:hypothetical protein n=1 Tax=Oceaniovalibus sp. ACAM 378 TaxID=2599923 RepID=UPI0011D9EA59|nr:hypothetical protein [Oceaniovalibus sp. ACAM 378]TYB85840.1 hypothetical protein FQ320_18480 [Oceaniovalibus sp. ACAM 378]
MTHPLDHCPAGRAAHAFRSMPQSHFDREATARSRRALLSGMMIAIALLLAFVAGTFASRAIAQAAHDAIWVEPFHG